MTETTPSGVTITATAPDGTTTNITEGVQALYDGVIQSMDWGSGFWSIEEAAPIADIAHLCGFQGVEETDRYLLERKREDRRKALARKGMPWKEAYEQVKREFPDP
jgi:hypothetical protein